MRMDYPTAVLEKAERLEQLLQRVAAGEPLDEVNEALGLNLDERQLVRAQAKYEAGGWRWEALIDGRYGHAQKVHSGIREWLYTRKERDEEGYGSGCTRVKRETRRYARPSWRGRSRRSSGWKLSRATSTTCCANAG
jgi:hypothetical protein